MSQDININNLRQSYKTQHLVESKASKNPFSQFQIWFDEVKVEDYIEPNAMNIATVNKEGEVSSRMVLLKEFDDRGFVFFTNYNSTKSQDLLSTNKAALNFWWDKSYRQVRITGQVEKISKTESEQYFHSRPKGSQLGAVASQQSEVIESYTVLEKQYQLLEDQYENQEVPCPDHWGGFRVVPTEFEFWQGRPNRLHDRLRYTKISLDEWKIDRLSP